MHSEYCNKNLGPYPGRTPCTSFNDISKSLFFSVDLIVKIDSVV